MKTEVEVRESMNTLQLVLAKMSWGGEDWTRLDSSITTLKWVLDEQEVK